MSVGVIWECHNYKASFPNLIPRNPKIALCVTEALDQGTQTPHYRDLFTNHVAIVTTKGTTNTHILSIINLFNNYGK